MLRITNTALRFADNCLYSAMPAALTPFAKEKKMLTSALGYRGAFTAPHRVAALTGQEVIDAGGTAVEAMVAAAAMIAVVYPHMNGIGGDCFWLIKRKGAKPIEIAGCGPAAEMATVDWYREQGHADAIPARGGVAALSVPGTLGGWKQALSTGSSQKPIPLGELLWPAASYAREGIAVTANQSACTADKLDTLKGVPGFDETFLVDGKPPAAGHRMIQTALGDTLETVGQYGIDAYYRGDIALTHAAFLEKHGSPLRYSDFEAYEAQMLQPLGLETKTGTLYNSNPPTQGISSLMILGIYERLGIDHAEGIEHIHGLVEATKQAFILRNAGLADPAVMGDLQEQWLSDACLDELAGNVKMNSALPWPHEPKEGDTIWMGAIDRYGTVVSFIQSVYWEFGSGLVCSDTGVFFQNRGAGFSLAEGPNQLAPGKRPFHTLNPALAELKDGRVIAYGTMGGEGQPQTQAAVFSRYAMHEMDLQEAITRPRWLLGKTWGEATTTLKLEDRIDDNVIAELRKMGHSIETIPAYSDLAGHAGGVALHENDLVEAATDPRSDGAALAF